MKRVLLLSTTTGYQLRSFDHAAQALGIELVLPPIDVTSSTIRGAIARLRFGFTEEWSSLETISREAEAPAVRRIIAVGDRPTLAARAAVRLDLPGHPPRSPVALRATSATHARASARRSRRRGT